MTFLDVEQILDAFFRQLPKDQFAQDRADDTNPVKRSFSSSDLRSQATVLAAAYANLNQIHDNKFITTTDELGLTRWEKDLFSETVDRSQPLAARRGNALGKFRAKGGIDYDTIKAILDPIFAAQGLDYDIVYWSGFNGGAWILDVSLLDVDTYLSLYDPLVAAGLGLVDCNFPPLPPGISSQDLEDIQRTAYTWEIRIHGHASAEFMAQLDLLATQIEPARSTHYIYNDFPGPVAP